jgi:hypothetical protein
MTAIWNWCFHWELPVTGLLVHTCQKEKIAAKSPVWTDLIRPSRYDLRDHERLPYDSSNDFVLPTSKKFSLKNKINLINSNLINLTNIKLDNWCGNINIYNKFWNIPITYIIPISSCTLTLHAVCKCYFTMLSQNQGSSFWWEKRLFCNYIVFN